MAGVAADRVSRIALGLYAAALAGVHGVFSVIQGPVSTPGAPFSAIGPPCEPSLVWHACLPALTIAPDLRTAGVLTLTTAALTALAALVLAGRRAAAALGAAALALLLVGGGFVPALTAAAAASTFPPRARAEGARTRWLARAWPWALAGLLAWGLGGWWLGTVANDALLELGGATFLLDLTLPVAVAVTARARSALRT
ncbi:MAG: hypothetical protein EA379_00695 [Phycisphaerales bacterium]|nr:MAG: hypothetical protein EA379_00695 [Phycisphaerales bacterium]